ncbi:porin [Sulfurimonas sp.]
MKKNMIKLAVGAAALLVMATSAQAGYTMKKKVGDVDTKLTIFGFSQLEMRGGDGAANGKGDNDSAVSFHAQRIRLGWKYSAGKVRSKVFLDFNQDSAANKTTDAGGASGIGVPDNIKDAFIAYRFDKAFIPKMGVIKMPHGMGFTMPGWNLDIAERGFDKKLVLERNMGLMISGRDIGFGNYAKVSGYEMGHERPWKGFGYDVMIANQAGRSAAVINAKEGNGNSYAARVMFDWTELIHVEASYALSENAGGVKGQTTYKYDPVTGTTPGTVLAADTEDYTSYDIGLDSNFLNGGNFKAEYISGHNVRGIKDSDETALSFTAQYAINNMFEPTVKMIRGSETSGTNADTHNLVNTYFGLNIFISPFNDKMNRSSKRSRNAQKVVLNYIMASGDTDTWKPTAGGGYRANAWIMQWQAKF